MPTWLSHAGAEWISGGLDSTVGDRAPSTSRAVDVDEWGFVITGGAFQTSMGGVFAAGDVRTGSTKQLGSAVGDGIAALLQVRRYLEVHRHEAKLAINA